MRLVTQQTYPVATIAESEALAFFPEEAWSRSLGGHSMKVFGNLAINDFLGREKATESEMCFREVGGDEEERKVPLKLTFKVVIVVWVGTRVRYVLILLKERENKAGGLTIFSTLKVYEYFSHCTILFLFFDPIAILLKRSPFHQINFLSELLSLRCNLRSFYIFIHGAHIDVQTCKP